MAYNKNQECSQRAIRRAKRGRPEKKDRSIPTPLQAQQIRKKPPTKPKNPNKIAKIQAVRDRPSLDNLYFSDLAHDIRFQEEENEAIERLLKYRHDNKKANSHTTPAYDPYIEKLLEDPFLPHLYREDVNFSIYHDGWHCSY